MAPLPPTSQVRIHTVLPGSVVAIVLVLILLFIAEVSIAKNNMGIDIAEISTWSHMCAVSGTGPIGLTGNVGPAGPAGTNGSTGAIGATGETGSAGPAGPTSPSSTGEVIPTGLKKEDVWKHNVNFLSEIIDMKNPAEEIHFISIHNTDQTLTGKIIRN
jgi:hypothetical protein